ncbi:hypothetical protein HCC61_08245 [Streptomyces sp. HNM0575]|uniref:hypothetical protein n=1 Tax=Streptomyces sp. HNM0575 TaxID=2716338 RepID=UPI00145EB910|nr:hypothetical protein [Streptomyces sp. HNM0575]NLU72662.1 hypothetical protein [Streptomyces sp. HNM0575]
MDQGAAAAFAGTAGAVGAVVGGLVTGFFTQRAARLGAQKTGEAMIEQVERQAVATREDWLLQHRLDAYMGLMQAYDRFVEQAKPFMEALTFEAANRSELFAMTKATELAVTQAYFKVRAFGPEGVREPANALRTAVNEFRGALDGWELALSSGSLDRGRQERRAEDRLRTATSAHAEFVTSVRDVAVSVENRPRTGVTS